MNAVVLMLPAIVALFLFWWLAIQWARDLDDLDDD